jgi:hypothetical protein
MPEPRRDFEDRGIERPFLHCVTSTSLFDSICLLVPTGMA